MSIIVLQVYQPCREKFLCDALVPYESFHLGCLNKSPESAHFSSMFITAGTVSNFSKVKYDRFLIAVISYMK